MLTPEQLTIPDKLDSLNVTKQAIRQAIADKGVEVPEGTTFYEYAGKIAEIQTGGKEYSISFASGEEFALTPSSAKAGEYVPLVADEAPSVIYHIKDVNGNKASVYWVVNSFDDVPEYVKPIFENVPQTFAAPPSTYRIAWFLMPPCDVKITVS